MWVATSWTASAYTHPVCIQASKSRWKCKTFSLAVTTLLSCYFSKILIWKLTKHWLVCHILWYSYILTTCMILRINNFYLICMTFIVRLKPEPCNIIITLSYSKILPVSYIQYQILKRGGLSLTHGQTTNQGAVHVTWTCGNNSCKKLVDWPHKCKETSNSQYSWSGWPKLILILKYSLIILSNWEWLKLAKSKN